MRKKLLIQTILFSLSLQIITSILYFILPKPYISYALLFLVPLFLATTLITNLFLFSANTENPNKFIRTFMLTTFLKFMFYILVLVAYVMMFRNDAVNFIISFFILFVFYLVFDVALLLNNKPDKR